MIQPKHQPDQTLAYAVSLNRAHYQTPFHKKTIDAIEQGNLLGTAKTRLLREATTYYYFGVCSGGASDYITIPKMPTNREYWVSYCCSVK